MIRHIVLFRLRPEVTETQRDELIAALNRLTQVIPEIRSFDVILDEVGSERSATFGLLSHFDDMPSLRRYQQHPDHQEVAAQIAALAEWSKAWDYTVSPENTTLS